VTSILILTALFTLLLMRVPVAFALGGLGLALPGQVADDTDGPSLEAATRFQEGHGLLGLEHGAVVRANAVGGQKLQHHVTCPAARRADGKTPSCQFAQARRRRVAPAKDP